MKYLNDENYTLVISVEMFEELKTLASTNLENCDDDGFFEDGNHSGINLLARQILEDARVPWRIK